MGGPLYVPPTRQRPRRRIGGGIRGPETRWPRIFALVPLHVGLTSQPSPSLFWWIDSSLPPDTGIRFYLVHDSNGQTVLQAPLRRPEGRGIQRISLADHGVELVSGVEYEWSIALEHGPSREQILVASGWIERIPPLEPSSSAAGIERVTDFARRGLWYDAFAAASELSGEGAEASKARALRSELLGQIGLAEVAAP